VAAAAAAEGVGLGRCLGVGGSEDRLVSGWLAGGGLIAAWCSEAGDKTVLQSTQQKQMHMHMQTRSPSYLLSRRLVTIIWMLTRSLSPLARCSCCCCCRRGVAARCCHRRLCRCRHRCSNALGFRISALLLLTARCSTKAGQPGAECCCFCCCCCF